MPHDPEAFADMVVMTVKAAMAPILADVKSLQTQIAGWESRWNDLGTLRERVAVVEAKEQRPAPEPVEPVELTPVLQRLAVAESKLEALPVAEKALGEMRDRMVAVETKAATEPRHEPVVLPSEPLTPLYERLSAAEARLNVLGDLRDRVITVETKTAAPVPSDPAVQDVRDRVLALESKAAPAFEVPADVLSRLSALEARPLPIVPLFEKSIDLVPVELRLTRLELQHEMKASELTPLSTAVSDLTKDVGAVRERLAVAETRSLTPGPPGENGKDGVNGLNGTLENIKVMRRSERVFEFCFKDGTPVEGGLIKMAYPVFDDELVYVKGRDYDLNTLVQWDASMWLAIKDRPSGVPGQGSADQTGWKLLIKRGQEGKPGRDGRDFEPPPVVSVGRSRA